MGAMVGINNGMEKFKINALVCSIIGKAIDVPPTSIVLPIILLPISKLPVSKNVFTGYKDIPSNGMSVANIRAVLNLSSSKYL